MNTNITPEDVKDTIRSYVEINQGDDATVDLILAVGAELLGVSTDTMLEFIKLSAEPVDNLNKILVMFDFETGDASCKYWTELAVVYTERKNLDKIKDNLISYMTSPAAEDLQYDDIVKDVLRESGFWWKYIENGIGNIPACDMFHRFEV